MLEIVEAVLGINKNYANKMSFEKQLKTFQFILCIMFTKFLSSTRVPPTPLIVHLCMLYVAVRPKEFHLQIEVNSTSPHKFKVLFEG